MYLVSVVYWPQDQFPPALRELTKGGVSLGLEGGMCGACVRRVLVYGSETWAIKAEDLAGLGRAERMMVGRMKDVWSVFKGWKAQRWTLEPFGH